MRNCGSFTALELVQLFMVGRVKLTQSCNVDYFIVVRRCAVYDVGLALHCSTQWARVPSRRFC